MIIQISLANAQDDKHQHELDKSGFWGRRAAGCLFRANTGRLLFALRSKHVLEPNTWSTWGGAVDDKETPSQCVLREIVEETGYTGRVRLTKLSVFSHSSGFKYHNFLASVADEFVPQLNWETQAYRWCEFGKWPTPLHPGVARMLSNPRNLELMR
jgi:8-oxo-dGTP pyrophosphatase MutT (NUDIX family)